MVINRTGGYGFKRPGNWEAGESGSLTQVIAPIQVGVPRPVIQADVVKSDANQFTDLGDLTTGDWDEVTLGNMAALTRTFRSENGLIRSDFKIKKSDGEFYLITVDFGVASNNNELYVMIKKSIESFQKIGSEE
ncbi:MAG: hypothetical protein HYR96_13660 [Deltaproteobacteria bacterium]|nr:hypothetical protein [Deltaproteobacteria bacterium]MBI3293824.1 hypothetical protein [Deltaproteobacteria bacterium]